MKWKPFPLALVGFAPLRCSSNNHALSPQGTPNRLLSGPSLLSCQARCPPGGAQPAVHRPKVIHSPVLSGGHVDLLPVHIASVMATAGLRHLSNLGGWVGFIRLIVAPPLVFRGKEKGTPCASYSLPV